MMRLRPAFLPLAFLLSLAGPVTGAERETVTPEEARRPGILPGSGEVGIWGGYRWFFEDGENLAGTGIGGARAAVNASRVLAFEFTAGYGQTTTLERSKLTHYFLGTVDLVFHLTPRRRAVPYLSLGAGVRYYAVPDRPAGEGTILGSDGRPLPGFRNPDADFLLDAAFGVKVFLTRRVLLRPEVRYGMPIGGASEAWEDEDGHAVADRWDNLQATLGISLMLGGARPRIDTDGDGIVDDEDYCPREPEDRDGFEDGDGCADPDNDQDGFADADDACPVEAENFNDFEDGDGCADEAPVVVAAPPPPPPEPEPEPEPPPPPPPEEVIRRFSGVIEGVWFENNSTDFTAASFPMLNSAAETLRSYPSLRVEVQGHASADGNDEYNRDLSQRRAEAVMRYMANLGVAADRLIAVGYGEDSPIADNSTPAGRAKNRRVEFRVIGQ
ncbi:OmpA family protein [Myxococcota bacterium]|nr:OmpA family protein [Myxococcota bacterium]